MGKDTRSGTKIVGASAKATSGRTLLSCAVCGEKFSLPNCHAKRPGVGKYCSLECQRKEQAIDRLQRQRACQVCSKIFLPRPGQVANGEGKFCSVKCFYSQNKGENHVHYGRKIPLDQKAREMATKIKNGSNKRGIDHPLWKEEMISGGYLFIKVKGEKKALHRHMMELFIERKLKSHEIVHHKDGDRMNNDIDNLLLTTRSNHMKIHAVDILEGQKKSRQRLLELEVIK